MSETGLVERLDGLLPLHHTTVCLTAHKGALAELVAQLRPFWPHVRRSVIEREDGVRYIHYWQPAEAAGGELQLYLEPTSSGLWACVVLDNGTLEPAYVARAGTLTELVWAVCAALEIGLHSRGVA